MSQAARAADYVPLIPGDGEVVLAQAEQTETQAGEQGDGGEKERTREGQTEPGVKKGPVEETGGGHKEPASKVLVSENEEGNLGEQLMGCLMETFIEIAVEHPAQSAPTCCLSLWLLFMVVPLLV